jgi:hypothetical protein
MFETPTPEQVALARGLYVEGEPVKAIVAKAGLRSLGILYRCLNGDFPDGSGIEPVPITLRRSGVRIRQRIGSRGALVARMWRTAERQVEEIEDRLKTAGVKLDECESNARTLAIVAKTLRELSAVDAAEMKRGKQAPKENNDSGVPRNIEELRRALTEKVEGFVAGGCPTIGRDAE